MDILNLLRSFYTPEEFLRDIHYDIDLGKPIQNPRVPHAQTSRGYRSSFAGKQTYRSPGKQTSLSQQPQKQNRGIEGKLTQRKVMNQVKHPSLFRN